MKINAKLFLLVFAIITFISITSASIYHILAQQLLQTQQSKNLINSANDFIFAFQDLIAIVDDEFNSKIKNNYESIDYNEFEFLDFIFKLDSDSEIDRNSIIIKDESKIYFDNYVLEDFFKYNSNLLVRKINLDDAIIYYGKQLNSETINDWSEKIRAGLALVEENVVTKFSDNKINKYYLPILSKLTRELKDKNNFELVYESLEDEDFSATQYTVVPQIEHYEPIKFVIFNTSKEAASFKDTMNLVTLIVVISGILLTIIFLFLFTTRFRKQIQYLSDGVSNITSGRINKRVKTITNDEIGNLAHAFNNMLDEIEKRDFAEKEYAELISIINRNPDLEQIGKETLRKIVSTTNVDAGVFYLYEESILKPFACFGISSTNKSLDEESAFYKKAKESKEIVEVNFTKSKPTIKTGIIELEISHLYILPVFYNNEIIGILELAAVNKPIMDIKQYLSRISDQLAIGLANSKYLKKLKNLVSELKQLNNAIQIQNLEITDKNKELVELHEKLKKGAEDLEIQTQKAIESEKVKSQFLANMSHELRTPQNSILGLTELILKDQSINPKTRERLNVVLRNGKKLLNLIENILEYSKLESGYEEVKKSKIYLSELVIEINNFVQPFFFEKDCEYHVNIPKEIDYEIFTDTKKLEQIIINLIGNASKFTEKGYVKFEVDVKENDLIIVIEDSGKGISESDKNIIFDEFTQADANLNRQFSGTGLGLAICKRYSEILNARIEVESILGEGSKFIVTIPKVVTENRKRVKPKNTFDTNQILKSLIISDGNHSIELVSDYLTSHSIIVEVKSSTELNLEYISSNKPDVIIFDILLKNLNGWSLLSEIKQSQTSKNIPLIIINMDEEANCGFGLDVFEYYYGQLNEENLIYAIKNIEEKHSVEVNNVVVLKGTTTKIETDNEFKMDGVKILNINPEIDIVQEITNISPDFILLDLAENGFNTFDLIDQIKSSLRSKNIPIIAFLGEKVDTKFNSRMNNSLLEITLLKQYHPLDILKIIKDRIELIDSGIFSKDHKEIYSTNNVLVPKSMKETFPNSKINILIVDDNSDARFTIGEIVTNLGYNPQFATDGYECLEKIRDSIPDLILLDIMMPKMDGFQTIREIRKDEKLNDTKVFALTAYAMLSDKEIIEKNGFNGLITKPVNTVQLERKLNQIFNVIIDEN